MNINLFYVCIDYLHYHSLCIFSYFPKFRYCFASLLVLKFHHLPFPVLLTCLNSACKTVYLVNCLTCKIVCPASNRSKFVKRHTFSYVLYFVRRSKPCKTIVNGYSRFYQLSRPSLFRQTIWLTPSFHQPTLFWNSPWPGLGRFLLLLRVWNMSSPCCRLSSLSVFWVRVFS